MSYYALDLVKVFQLNQLPFKLLLMCVKIKQEPEKENQSLMVSFGMIMWDQSSEAGDWILFSVQKRIYLGWQFSHKGLYTPYA